MRGDTTPIVEKVRWKSGVFREIYPFNVGMDIGKIRLKNRLSC